MKMLTNYILCFSVVVLSVFSTSCLGNKPAYKNGEELYFIAYGVKSLSSIENESNVLPWMREEKGADQVSDEFEFVGTFSHGCHFYEAVYELETLSGESVEKASVRFQPGEFCDVSNYIFAHPTLVKLIYWDDKYYLEQFAKLRFDENDKGFFVGDESVREFKAEGAYAVLNTNKASEACEGKRYLSPIEVERMKAEPHIKVFDDRVCYTKGVYAESLK